MENPGVPLSKRWCCVWWLSWDKAVILSEGFWLGRLHRHWDFMHLNDRKWSFPFLTKLLKVYNQLFVIFKFHFIRICYTNKMFLLFIYLFIFYCVTVWPCLQIGCLNKRASNCKGLFFSLIIFKDWKSLLNLLLLSSLYTDRMCCEHMTLSCLSLPPADSLMPNWSASCFSAIWMIIRESKARRQSAG